MNSAFGPRSKIIKVFLYVFSPVFISFGGVKSSLMVIVLYPTESWLFMMLFARKSAAVPPTAVRQIIAAKPVRIILFDRLIRQSVRGRL